MDGQTRTKGTRDVKKLKFMVKKAWLTIPFMEPDITLINHESSICNG